MHDWWAELMKLRVEEGHGWTGSRVGDRASVETTEEDASVGWGFHESGGLERSGQDSP